MLFGEMSLFLLMLGLLGLSVGKSLPGLSDGAIGGPPQPRKIIGLHHINSLVDEVVEAMRPEWKPHTEIEDLRYDSDWGSVTCVEGRGSSLDLLRRHGFARQRHYYGELNYVNATLRLEPFEFGYDRCFVTVNGTTTESSLSGILVDAPVYINMLVDSSSSSPCTAEILEMELTDATVTLSDNVTTSAVTNCNLADFVLNAFRNNVLNVIRSKVVECINLTIIEHIDVKYSNLTHCRRT